MEAVQRVELARKGVGAMTRVIIESPYAGDVARNVRYARLALLDSLLRGEAPFASHLLYTQSGVLDDDNAGDRRLGVDAGNAWRSSGDLTAFYLDLGWSPGMLQAREQCESMGLSFEERRLGVAEEEVRCPATFVGFDGVEHRCVLPSGHLPGGYHRGGG